MTLIKETYKYAKENTITKYYISIIIFNYIFLTTIMSDLIVRLNEDNLHILLPWILGMTVIIPIINRYLVCRMSNDIINQVTNNFIEDKYKHYSQISYENKIKMIYDTFIHALTPSKYAIGNMIGWGFNNFIQLVSIIISVFWTFWRINILTYFFVLCLGFGIFYFAYLKTKQDEFTKKDKKLRKERQSIEAKKTLNGTPFQYNELSYLEMVEYEYNINKCNKDIDSYWDDIMSETNINLVLLSVIVIWFTTNDIKNFLLISSIMHRFTNGCENLMRFMTQYNRYKNDFETLYELFKDAPPTPKPKEIYISEIEIDIQNIDILLSDSYRLKLDDNFGEFKITQKTNIIIIGPSGSGKSSLIKGIFGLLDKANVILSIGEGKNFYHTVSDYFQEIKEKMPSSKVTIRDYFRKEQNDEVIKKYLLQGWTNDEYNRIFQAIRNSNKKKDHVIIDMEYISDFDLPLPNDFDNLINEKLSGGQKSRLILWTRGYFADKLNKEIIILDEPCPDVDHIGYKENIIRFFKSYKNKAKIMVAHPCECKEKFLFPMFDIIIDIGNDGIIRKRKWNSNTLKLE